MGLSNEISFILIFLAVVYLWIKTLDRNLPMRFNMSVSVNPKMQPWPTWAYFKRYSLILKPVPTILLSKKMFFQFSCLTRVTSDMIFYQKY